MVDTPDPTQVEFEAMLRRYLLKLGSRYAPVLAVGLAVLLLLVFVPTTQPSGNGAGGLQTAAGPGSGNSAGSSVGGGGSTGAAGASGTSGTGTAVGGSAGSSGSLSGGVLSGGVPANGPAAGVPIAGGGTYGGGSTSGVALTGVPCGPGVRQFGWSKFGPLCVAAFHGANGGATAQGVTPTTITLTYRLANSAQQSAIDAAAGAANINQTDLVADLQSYVKFFNTQFELYGRHVVLKAYQGQGDYLAEDQGQDLGATQADAVTAHDLGAFGDVTFSLEASQPYEEDLAAEHVIGFSSVGLSQQWFQQHAPYEYSVQSSTGTAGLTDASAVICRRLAGLPAQFAGDPVTQRTPRVFGVIYPETPVYTAEVNQWKSQVAAQCGIHPARVIAYAINVASYEQEAVSAMAQLKAAGVTTILCACDPIVPIFLTNAAAQQNYLPEWFATWFGDPVARDYNQQVWAHVITGGIQFPPPTQTEAYKAFELAFPGKQPAEEPPSSPAYFYVPYYTLMHVFDALQAAGPNLTPATFQQGMFSLPTSKAGDNVEGQWVFGNGAY
ncbi:MAG TPA: hypothetical protein VNY84_08295, partial [Acidimicrobiales bacterium]|nr:hypothetical protein [Acidimicrobiales bacterium]